MKTIITILILLMSVSLETTAQNISKLFGEELTSSKRLNFQKGEESIWVLYDASQSSDSVPRSFYLISDDKKVSCEVYDDGTIKTAYIDYLMKEKDKAIPEIVYSVEIAKDDHFINYCIQPIVDNLLKDLASYTRIEYNH